MLVEFDILHSIFPTDLVASDSNAVIYWPEVVDIKWTQIHSFSAGDGSLNDCCKFGNDIDILSKQTIMTGLKKQ